MRAVIATDRSDAFEAAIGSETWLECLGRYGINKVDLVTVTSPNVTTGMPGSDVGERTRRALERERAPLEAQGFDVETHVVRGTPHRRINGLADRVDADLIVVGSRGRSPLEERFIGSTTRDMARTAVRPLLVQRIARTDGGRELAREHLFGRVLYATDFSENAERAFEQFTPLSGATGEALLVHVRPPDRRVESDPVDDATERLDELAATLGGMGVEARTQVRAGEAVEEILAAEAEFEPTLVLIGSRGRSRIRRLLLGSTSADVTARSGCNVLLVPPGRTR